MNLLNRIQAAALGAIAPGAVVLLISSFAATASFAGTAPRIHKVSIVGMKFVPEVVELKSGETVVWTNDDIVPHTVTASGKQFDSKQMNAGATFRFTARKAGKIDYKCNYHPQMKGQLIVK